eukprot:CAMPEP_0204577878 /NCGR_PEP_ID=MMETSP0661-20131031/42600_1 /ASSEMBLY_ACC=CAM_ASM_000606 /TAXON_ID=109239 /ORGANISM="Alexandrium margalefi, Strain AMGDE01CS-322" /LENGTH=140 /DNA_ID=CAMNT_0051586755 /DNA_START=89 /DNA_END=509 /DNA_ORIENTATION=-
MAVARGPLTFSPPKAAAPSCRGNGRVVEDKGLDASLKPAAHPSSPPQAPRVALTLGARDAGLACLKDGLVGRIDDVQDLAHTLQDLSSTDSTSSAISGPAANSESPRVRPATSEAACSDTDGRARARSAPAAAAPPGRRR